MSVSEKIAVGAFTIGCGVAGISILNSIISRDESTKSNEQKVHVQHSGNGLENVLGGIVLGEVVGWGLLVLVNDISGNKNS